MSKKCVSFSKSKLGLETADNRKSFYAGWDAALAEQAEQEPVGEMIDKAGYKGAAWYLDPPATGTKLYSSTVRTKDLTDDEIDDIIMFNMPIESPRTFARAVIAADREKNNV